jgi:hypothetical protein
MENFNSLWEIFWKVMNPKKKWCALAATAEKFAVFVGQGTFAPKCLCFGQQAKNQRTEMAKQDMEVLVAKLHELRLKNAQLVEPDAERLAPA